MFSIWKYPLNTSGATELQMPAGAKVLSMQLQGGTPTLWAKVDTTAPLVERAFHVIGTGWEFDFNPGEFIGTFQMAGGTFVFHVFEVTLS